MAEFLELNKPTYGPAVEPVAVEDQINSTPIQVIPLLRQFGGLHLHATVSEHQTDTAVITDHPTEYGALISDHQYMLPKRVDVEIAYSLSTTGGARNNAAASNGIGNVTGVDLITYYNYFLGLQLSAILFTINTGKRFYTNMQIEAIEETTDVSTENILKLRLRCREVLIVYTTTTSVGNPANPWANNAPTNVGNVQPVAQTNSQPQTLSSSMPTSLHPIQYTPTLSSSTSTQTVPTIFIY